MKTKFMILIACALCLFVSLSAVSAVDVNDADNTVLSVGSDDVIADSSSANENNNVNNVLSSPNSDGDIISENNNADNLADDGEFINVSEAYDLLNEFRLEDGVWQWNKDNTTKTVFNTNDTNQLKPLVRDTALEETAKTRAKELVQLYSHTRPDDSPCFTAFPDGYTAVGENIAMGYTTCADVTEAWKETNYTYDGQGHRRNMLRSQFNSVGIAAYRANGTIYWVQDFGYIERADDNTTDNGIYVNGSLSENGNGSKDSPFNNLKSALDKIESGDTIYIAPGQYTGLNNTNLEINKAVNLTNWTSGDVIFDGENKNTIFNITGAANVIGLTFKNANNSAVTGNRKGNILNCSFMDNTGINGGAVNGCDDVINSTFINNTAEYGGAAYGCNNLVNSSFINNTAEYGAAIYGCDNVTNCVFSGNKAGNASLSVQDVVKYYHGPEKFIVNVTNSEGIPLTGKTVVIWINGAKYGRTTNENGTASLDLTLSSGVYPVNVTLDDEIAFATVEILSTVESYNLTKYYRNESQFIAEFKDFEGKPLENGTASYNVNGINYYRAIKNGAAKLNINLPVGNYTITVNNPFTGENSASNIEVLSTINAEDVTKYFLNGTQYYATFLDGEGNPLTNGTAKFNVNGKFYYRTIKNGTVKVEINLPPSTYIITAYSPYNNQTFASEIYVMPTLIANNLTKKYGNTTPFEVFVVNGTCNHDFDDYKDKLTNLSDYFSKYNITDVSELNLNETTAALSETSHTLSNMGDSIPYLHTSIKNLMEDIDEANECIESLSNQVITAKDESDVFAINLLASELSESLLKVFVDLDFATSASAPLDNANVTFNINGIMYNRTTDNDGFARLNINLPVKEYTITSTYGSSSISNKINITA